MLILLVKSVMKAIGVATKMIKVRTLFKKVTQNLMRLKRIHQIGIESNSLIKSLLHN